MRIYVPYGQQWYGYFMRRLAERPANVRFFLRSLITNRRRGLSHSQHQRTGGCPARAATARGGAEAATHTRSESSGGQPGPLSRQPQAASRLRAAASVG